MGEYQAGIHKWALMCIIVGMIVKIKGILESVEGGGALVQTDTGLTYEVLVPAYTAARLGGSLGQEITLHTLHFIESIGQGNTLLPRLAGFTTMEDRRFFELFTTCKGIGNRKALRAMTLNTGQIAAAIADRDAAMLKSLPEIGARTAETVIATLHGKVDAFVAASAYSGGAAAGGATGGGAAGGGLARETLEVLLALGENHAQVVAWIDQALSVEEDDRPGDVQQLIARVYQIKAGG